MRNHPWLWALAVIVALALALVAYRVCFVRPRFDPDAIAAAETRMWQAYYAGDKREIGLQLMALLRSQYGLSLLDAQQVGERFAGAAIKFKSARADYDTVVLPDLAQAYRRLRDLAGASFDPEATARAELAWWVARRTPGQNSPEQVGDKIAELYAVLYGRSSPAFQEAGRLRAQAAHLRDLRGVRADWDKVHGLLRASYRSLQQAIQHENSTPGAG